MVAIKVSIEKEYELKKRGLAFFFFLIYYIMKKYQK